jgi:hypothetical protein
MIGATISQMVGYSLDIFQHEHPIGEDSRIDSLVNELHQSSLDIHG